MKTDPRSSPMTLTSHERFFDESRLLSNRLNSAEDPFGQFVREHQERFAALTASIMGPTENSSASASSQASEVIGKQSSASTAFSNNNSENLEHESNRQQPLALQPPSAADLVASILNGKSISRVSYCPPEDIGQVSPYLVQVSLLILGLTIFIRFIIFVDIVEKKNLFDFVQLF